MGPAQAPRARLLTRQARRESGTGRRGGSGGAAHGHAAPGRRQHRAAGHAGRVCDRGRQHGCQVRLPRPSSLVCLPHVRERQSPWRRGRYVRPRLSKAGPLAIVAGRHPLLEQAQPGITFTPNDTYLSGACGHPQAVRAMPRHHVVSLPDARRQCARAWRCSPGPTWRASRRTCARSR